MSKEKEAYFKGLNQNERLTALRENAVKQYNKNVVRNFSEEELTEMKSTLSEVDISMNDAEIEKKEITAEVSGRIKVFKESRAVLLRDLKNKYYETEESVFDIDDQEACIMMTLDAKGTIISTRRLTPQEKQIKIKNLISNG